MPPRPLFIPFQSTENSVGGMEGAHESSVFALDWHPMGHILVSGSNDHTTRFWTRNRPGDVLHDKFNISRKDAEALGMGEEEEEEQEQEDLMESLPGLGDLAMQERAAASLQSMPAIPGLNANGPPGIGGNFSRQYEDRGGPGGRRGGGGGGGGDQGRIWGPGGQRPRGGDDRGRYPNQQGPPQSGGGGFPSQRGGPGMRHNAPGQQQQQQQRGGPPRNSPAAPPGNAQAQALLDQMAAQGIHINPRLLSAFSSGAAGQPGSR
ncbi:hypothetical protein BDK51DRAFT_37978 [Blyttiomyces helicus]|uniref:Polyadenylation factor subunit 2 n=1 Tax=Blyttiomyces helicus TaxID=388810 RepID=A0A4V1IPU5_9FUNG|nr:hypothetical protein BDK51DRAFT_37978 [Blyttiomyces helicus]|eukprot:RKO84277.1 hypothetical protein BDK51DRAFT_37978 [Blyttiomyces helicus]